MEPRPSNLALELAQTGEATLASVADQCRVMTPMLGALLGTLAGVNSTDWSTRTGYGLLLAGAGVGLVAGWLVGQILAVRWFKAVEHWREHVRHNLLDKGLLQLVLEHDPHERLPRLVPVWEKWFGRAAPQGEAGTVRQRLGHLVQTYYQCCNDAGLVVRTESQKRSQQRIFQVAYLAFAAGFVVQLLLSQLSSPVLHKWGTLALWTGMAVMWINMFRDVPLGPALDTAVQLELGKILGEQGHHPASE